MMLSYGISLLHILFAHEFLEMCDWVTCFHPKGECSIENLIDVLQGDDNQVIWCFHLYMMGTCFLFPFLSIGVRYNVFHMLSCRIVQTSFNLWRTFQKKLVTEYENYFPKCFCWCSFVSPLNLLGDHVGSVVTCIQQMFTDTLRYQFWQGEWTRMNEFFLSNLLTV